MYCKGAYSAQIALAGVCTAKGHLVLRLLRLLRGWFVCRTMASSMQSCAAGSGGLVCTAKRRLVLRLLRGGVGTAKGCILVRLL